MNNGTCHVAYRMDQKCICARLIFTGVVLLSSLTVVAQSAAPVAKAPQEAAAIEGRVIEAGTGVPLGGVQVLLLGAPGEAQAAPVKTSEDGKFKFDQLTPSTYQVVVSTMSGYFATTRRVPLSAGQRVTGLDLTARKFSVISGRILDSDRSPVAGATVAVRQTVYSNDRPMEMTTSARSNDRGEFRIANAWPGPHYIVVGGRVKHIQKWDPNEDEKGDKDEPILADVRTYFPNSTTREGAATVTVRAGENLEGVDVFLARERTVCVRSRLADSSGGARILVRVEELALSVVSGFAEASLAAGSGFQVCGIPPGSYRLIASQGADSADARYATEIFQVDKRSVRLPDIQLTAMVQMRGRLVIEGAKETAALSAPVLVSLPAKDRQGRLDEQPIVSLDHAGAFVIPAAIPDEHWLQVRLPDGYYVRSASVGGVDVWRNPLRVAADYELQLVLGTRGPILTGQVVDRENKPVSGATVMLGAAKSSALSAPDELLTRYSDHNGQFTFTGMAPGEYRILSFLNLPSHEVGNPTFFRATQIRAEPVTLDEGDRRTITCVVIEYQPQSGAL